MRLTRQNLCFAAWNKALAFPPISDGMVDPDEPTSNFQCFFTLTQSLAEWATAQSSKYPIVYIETDYHGGTGAQAAVAWKDGSMVLGPS